MGVWIRKERLRLNEERVDRLLAKEKGKEILGLRQIGEEGRK